MKKALFSLLMALCFSLQATNEQTSDHGYHEKLNQFVKLFLEKHPVPYRYPKYKQTWDTERTTKKIKLVIEDGQKLNGMQLEKLCEAINNFDFKNSKKEDVSQETHDAAKHAHWLSFINEEFSIKDQYLDDNGDLITEFVEDENCDKAFKLYIQVPAVFDVICD